MIQMSNILKVKANLRKYKTIKTNKSTSRIIDGSYNSVYKGRSMNFDELRDYVPGDEIRDIDWKATARSQKVLVRQFIAEKKHNIMLVIDSNKRMLGQTRHGIDKKEAGLISAGGLAYLVGGNGDYVGATFCKGDGLVQYFPLKTGMINIENILANYDSSVTEDNTSSIQKCLEYLIHRSSTKMIIVIVTDLYGICSIDEAMLKRLVFMNDVLLISVSDTDTMGKKVYNYTTNSYLPAFISESKSLARREIYNRNRMQDMARTRLNKYGIASITVDDPEDIDVQIASLFEMRKRMKN